MKPVECLREQELIETVTHGRWPEGCDSELRAHIATCSICGDALQLCLSFNEDRETAKAGAQIPSAGLVWWRAELRARQEAMRTAARPITFIEAFGAAAGTGLAVAILSRAWPWLKTFLGISDLSGLSPYQWGVFIGVALAVLVVAPLTMYLVLSDE